MFHGSTQQVAVRSNVPGTELYVNEALIGRDSGVTTFHKNKNYTLTARRPGCSDVQAIATKSFDATTLLGILVDFGIFSIFLIDGAATGAWKQFDQTSFVLDPNCGAAGQVPVYGQQPYVAPPQYAPVPQPQYAPVPPPSYAPAAAPQYAPAPAEAPRYAPIATPPPAFVPTATVPPTSAQPTAAPKRVRRLP